MEKKMKTFKRISWFLLAALWITACVPTPTPAPTSAVTVTAVPPSAIQAMPSTTPEALIAVPALGTPTNPYAPQPDDASMMSAPITVDSASIGMDGAQPRLDLAYHQPTPCFKLRLQISAPDANNKITINAYAVAIKDKACTLMALATPLHASLDLGAFASGHYAVWLNGNKIGEFDTQ
jgi:hypothetical protein